MRQQLIALFMGSVFLQQASGQISCPVGYELRKVKCASPGELTEKCLPADYKCMACWRIAWPKRCNGEDNGAYEAASSFDEAQKIARDRIGNGTRCSSPRDIDYSVYLIYMQGGPYCKLSGPAPQSGGGANQSGGGGVNAAGSETKPTGRGKTTVVKPDPQLEALAREYYTRSYIYAIHALTRAEKTKPALADSLQRRYWPQIQYYHDIFKKEYDKGKGANIALLRQYRRELDGLVERLRVILMAK